MGFLSKLTFDGTAQWEELIEPTATYTGQFTRETATINRIFRVPQASLNSFYAEAFPSEFPRVGKHPTFPFLFISNIDFGPMPGSTLADNSGVAEHDYWQLSVTYTPLEIEPKEEIADPAQPADFLTGSVSFTTETMTLPGWGGLKWSDAATEVKEPEVQPFLVIPVSQWSIQIPRAKAIPWAAMRLCRGKVNADFFWGAYPQTALYTGMGVNYRFSNDGTRQYDLEHHFSEKLIVWNQEDADGTTTNFYGWNAYYNPSTKNFDTIVTDDDKPLYSLTSFFPQLLQ